MNDFADAPIPNSTSEWRIAAHDAFDWLWKSKMMSRDAAYRLLSQRMGLPPEQAHIAQFNEEQCRKVLAVVAPLRALRGK